MCDYVLSNLWETQTCAYHACTRILRDIISFKEASRVSHDYPVVVPVYLVHNYLAEPTFQHEYALCPRLSDPVSYDHRVPRINAAQGDIGFEVCVDVVLFYVS